jgi:hypothetical protein
MELNKDSHIFCRILSDDAFTGGNSYSNMSTRFISPFTFILQLIYD